MSFLTPMLLGGIGLIALPIVLHLVMRQEPKLLLFPALRFVRQRRDSNRRRVKLRHWLLLAMRCLLIALFAFALARPTLRGSGLKGKEGAPLAVAMVVDNSPRMQYVHKNRTRLDEATEIAGKLLNKLPADTQVAVVDLGRAAGGFARDLGTARTRLSNLRASASIRPLAEVAAEAITLVADKEEYRQEVFLYTDLSSAAWNEEGLQTLSAALSAEPDVKLYLIDVGVDEPTNASLGDLKVRRTVLRPGESLHVETLVETNEGGSSTLVELWLSGDNGDKMTKRGQQIVAATDKSSSDKPAEVAFEVTDLPLGTHQAMVKLATNDPLAVDNERYFTVEVRPPERVLLVAEKPSDALFVQEALNPTLWEQPLRFVCETMLFDELAQTDLTKYKSVLLLDPPAQSTDTWQQLLDFANQGGGVGLFLGHRARRDAFNSVEAQQLLPGPLVRKSRDATYLRPRRLDHPALVGLRDYEESIPWKTCNVFTYWQFEDVADDTYPIATYANGDPAILERTAGRGRIITMTTPISDSLDPEGRDPWNVLTAPAVAWPFVAIVEELTGYLTQDSTGDLTFAAGTTARVSLDANQQISSYVLRQPDGQAMRRTATPGERTLQVSVTDQLGNYRLTSGGSATESSGRLDRGFSINLPAETTNLARVAPETLLDALPEGRAEVAQSLTDAQDYVDVGSRGRELFSWIMAIVTIVWCGEHLLANRFYRSAP
ncbi:BatA domain-containing protein [Adhaeretor mobilis]|uniref:Aerotolerance regulator N-terminal domain-containing protein n=1 Tax=Adhaeretor mobilis TaxID=1930276 RepID=A0A517N1S5_9BACT|nr:BatA domain-containing protein [Adhaeretor mobilis]QDT01090.1 hypothetical protein HG15A2_44320 [Adhaeretor mobilis]